MTAGEFFSHYLSNLYAWLWFQWESLANSILLLFSHTCACHIREKMHYLLNEDLNKNNNVTDILLKLTNVVQKIYIIVRCDNLFQTLLGSAKKQKLYFYYPVKLTPSIKTSKIKIIVLLLAIATNCYFNGNLNCWCGYCIKVPIAHLSTGVPTVHDHHQGWGPAVGGH